jgi:hypothetical protein
VSYKVSLVLPQKYIQLRGYGSAAGCEAAKPTRALQITFEAKPVSLATDSSPQ